MNGLAKGLIVAFALGAIAAMYKISTAPGQEQPLDPFSGARYACEQWTRANSKLGVGEVLDSYQIAGRKLKPGHVAVGVDYRTKGVGLKMYSECEYQQVGKNLVLVKASSGPSR